MEQKVRECVKQIRKITDFKPQAALILGSGLGALADEIECVASIDYHEIPGFPVSTVAGHNGRFVFGLIGDTKVVIMQGRVHYYEGYSMEDVVLPVRVMCLLGAKILFLTNAAGGISEKVEAGDLMMLTDQISSFVPSPLIGKNVDSFGVRFPSMDTIYDLELRKILTKEAKVNDIVLKEVLCGVYLNNVQDTTDYELKTAEVKMFGMFGADAVGMSTAVEAIVGRHMGMRVCGVSCISNMAGGTAANPLSHEEVKEVADRVAPKFKTLVKSAIERMC